MKPSMADRIARHAEDNRERDLKEHERVSRAIARRKEREEFIAWKERMGFDLYLTALEICRRLEELREANEPKDPDDEWNEDFCKAIELLPEARRFYEDMAMECTKER